MSVASINGATGRIAEIRSMLGRPTSAAPGFGQRLEAAVDAGRPAVSVAEAVTRPDPAPSATLATIASAALRGAPGIAIPPTAAPVESPRRATSSIGFDPAPVSNDTPYAQLFNEAGERHGVSPRLLASVAEVESGFDPTAVSHAGAGGLMQFMPATAEEMGVDRFDPASAVDGAARYLARDLARFGDLELAIAAYNAGPGAVAAHGAIPPFTETQHYVQKVLTALESRR